MSKGPRISPTVKRTITEEALRERNKPRRALVAELRDRIERMGEPVPADETIEKLISWARRHEPSPEDAPWSLGACAKIGIPLGSIPAVLRVWKHHLACSSRALTIREAKWVARLQAALPDKSTADVNFLAMCYALREQSCEALGETFGTSSFDAILLMSRWELATAFLVGKVQLSQSPIDWVGPSPTKVVGSIGFEAAVDAERSVLVRLIPLQLGKQQPGQDELRRRIGDLNLGDWLSDLSVSDTAAWVYAYWIQYLSYGSKWESFTLVRQLDIISRLREWIQNHAWTASPPYFAGPSITKYVEEMRSSPLCKPTELLVEVGYEGQ